jgi:cyanophycin synthetase
MKRIPAFVVGNGTNTIKELINKENKNPLRGKEHEKTLTQIPIDAELKRFVTSQ